MSKATTKKARKPKPVGQRRSDSLEQPLLFDDTPERQAANEPQGAIEVVANVRNETGCGRQSDLIGIGQDGRSTISLFCHQCGTSIFRTPDGKWLHENGRTDHKPVSMRCG